MRKYLGYLEVAVCAITFVFALKGLGQFALETIDYLKNRKKN